MRGVGRIALGVALGLVLATLLALAASAIAEKLSDGSKAKLEPTTPPPTVVTTEP